MRIVSTRFFFICTLIVVIAGVLSISFHAFVSRASIYNLYPSTCLGGWENTHLASGEPEAFEGAGAPAFTETNSARFDGSTHAQIYCGGFSGDVLENTVPKKILVKFSWAIEYPKLDIEEFQDDDITTADLEQIEKSPEINNQDTSAEPADQPLTELNVNLEIIESETPEPPMIIESESESESPLIEEEIVQPEVVLPESSPEQPLQEPTVSIFNLFTTIAHAQETDDITMLSADAISEIASTTMGFATSTSESAYGLVEVVYTFDGVEWESLGYVEKDEFGDKYFEIPIEEASDWENISKIQIGVQSVPVVDGVAPIIYLDSVWIEAEYEYTNQNDASQIANVANAVGQVLEDVIEEIIPAEEEEVAEDALLEDAFFEESLQPIIESVPLPPRLLVRNFTKEIIIDPNATHYCEAEPFSIDVSGRSYFSTKIMLKKSQNEDYELEIGSLPEGIDVKFSKNGDYLYDLDSDENIVSLRIHNEEGSRIGNFTIPVIFTKKGKEDLSTICQINIVNLE